MNETASRMEAHALRDESPFVECTREDRDVPVRADRPATLTDELNRAEMHALRIRLKAQPVVAEVAIRRSPFGLPTKELAPRLQPVNRICQRWAVSIGNGLPNWAWDLPKKSRPTPLDDETAVIVDTIIQKRIPQSSRKFVVKWYRTDIPLEAMSREMIEEYHGRRAPRLREFNFKSGKVEEIRKFIDMTDEGIVICWNLTLDLLRDKFAESQHKELLRLLSVRWS